MKVIANTKNMDHDEWLVLRRLGIGGSDAGAICGLNRWRSAIDVWVDKTSTEPPEHKDSEAARLGRDLEDYVAKRFCEATGKKVRRRNAMMQHDEHEFMLANIDREVVGENALLECKTAIAYKSKEWADGAVPDSYAIQCYHYMAVTGCDRVYIACLIMGIGFEWRVIERDDDMIADLIEIESDFWNLNVLAKEMPAPDGSEAAQKVINAHFSRVNGETVELDMIPQLERMDEIETLMTSLKAEQDQLKQQIMIAMGENEIAHISDRKITWKLQAGSRRIDTKKLKTEMPDIYEKYAPQGKATRVFRWK